MTCIICISVNWIVVIYCLQNWYKWFPRNQILILDSEKLTQDPSEVLGEVEDFFGLEHKLTSDLFYFGEKKGFFCYKLNGTDSCMPSNKGTKHVEISEKLNTTLTEYFRPLNKQFFSLCNKTFHWWLVGFYYLQTWWCVEIEVYMLIWQQYIQFFREFGHNEYFKMV